MAIARTIGRIAAVLATVGALTVLAGVAHAQGPRPPGMSQGEYRALMLRSEALDEAYGVGTQAVTAAAPQATSAPSGFAWGAFGIGVAVTLGLTLVAGGVARHRLQATRRGSAYRTT